jgi:hypothetical protein
MAVKRQLHKLSDHKKIEKGKTTKSANQPPFSIFSTYREERITLVCNNNKNQPAFLLSYCVCAYTDSFIYFIFPNKNKEKKILKNTRRNSPPSSISSYLKILNTPNDFVHELVGTSHAVAAGFLEPSQKKKNKTKSFSN